MKTVTVTITPRQAERIANAAQHGEIVIQLKRSAAKGQHGGFLPLLGALAMPLASAAVGGLTNLAIDKLMGKGHGHCVTCTPKQFDSIAHQVGSGEAVILNFKVSKNKKSLHPHRHAGMLGAGIGDLLKPIIARALPMMQNVGKALFTQGVKHAPALLNKAKDEGIKAVSNLAGKTTQKIGQFVDRNLFAKKNKNEPATPKPVTHYKGIQRTARNPHGIEGKCLRLAGKGVRLAGNGKKNTEVRFKSVML